MKKIIFLLALLSLGVSKAQVVGGYLPLNSTKSFTAGNSTFSNVIARGTLSVGSTATVQSLFTPSSTIGTVKILDGQITFNKLQSGISSCINWNWYNNTAWATGIDVTTKDLFLAWDSVGGQDRIRLSPGGKIFLGGAGTPSANACHVTIKSAGTTSSTGAFGVISSTNSGLASTPFLFYVRDDGKVKIGGTDSPTDMLDVTGNIAVRSGVFVSQGNGSVGAPAYTFSNALTSGLACNLGGADRISLVSAGSIGLEISSTTANFNNHNISNALNISASGPITTTKDILSSGKTYGIGYATGSGSTVTQASSRTTSVTINSIVGSITLVSAVGSTSWQSFTVSNSVVAATDIIILNQKSGSDIYMKEVSSVGNGSFVISFATTGGTTTEQPVFNFAVIKGVSN